MALEDRFAQHDKVIVDKFVDPTAPYQMSTYDYVVRPRGTSAVAIQLPPVAEAKGRFYSILSLVTGGALVTVTDKGDSEYWGSDVSLGTGEKALFYSDGRAWHIMLGAGAAFVTAAPST